MCDVLRSEISEKVGSGDHVNETRVMCVIYLQRQAAFIPFALIASAEVQVIPEIF
jgi:hypothetical protein